MTDATTHLVNYALNLAEKMREEYRRAVFEIKSDTSWDILMILQGEIERVERQDLLAPNPKFDEVKLA